MSEIHDPFEAELASLRPHEPSPQLKQRIAGHLAPVFPVRSRRRWELVVASGVVAVGLVLTILFGKGIHESNERPTLSTSHEPMNTTDVVLTLPTLTAYRHALSRSPEALDALLAKHASRAPMFDPQLAQIEFSIRSDATIRSLTGDF